MNEFQEANDELRDQLEAVREKRGLLTPQAVVEEARDASHPLHERFEWDDALAGEAHRHNQARQLIRKVRVRFEVPTGETRTVRGYVSMPIAQGARAYEPTEDVVQDDFGRRLLLNHMRRDIESLRTKYAHMTEFSEVLRDVLGESAAS